MLKRLAKISDELEVLTDEDNLGHPKTNELRRLLTDEQYDDRKSTHIEHIEIGIPDEVKHEIVYENFALTDHIEHLDIKSNDVSRSGSTVVFKTSPMRDESRSLLSGSSGDLSEVEDDELPNISDPKSPVQCFENNSRDDIVFRRWLEELSNSAGKSKSIGKRKSESSDILSEAPLKVLRIETITSADVKTSAMQIPLNINTEYLIRASDPIEASIPDLTVTETVFPELVPCKIVLHRLNSSTSTFERNAETQIQIAASDPLEASKPDQTVTEIAFPELVPCQIVLRQNTSSSLNSSAETQIQIATSDQLEASTPDPNVTETATSSFVSCQSTPDPIVTDIAISKLVPCQEVLRRMPSFTSASDSSAETQIQIATSDILDASTLDPTVTDTAISSFVSCKATPDLTVTDTAISKLVCQEDLRRMPSFTSSLDSRADNQIKIATSDKLEASTPDPTVTDMAISKLVPCQADLRRRTQAKIQIATTNKLEASTPDPTVTDTVISKLVPCQIVLRRMTSSTSLDSNAETEIQSTTPPKKISSKNHDSKQSFHSKSTTNVVKPKYSRTSSDTVTTKPRSTGFSKSIVERRQSHSVFKNDVTSAPSEAFPIFDDYVAIPTSEPCRIILRRATVGHMLPTNTDECMSDCSNRSRLDELDPHGNSTQQRSATTGNTLEKNWSVKSPSYTTAAKPKRIYKRRQTEGIMIDSKSMSEKSKTKAISQRRNSTKLTEQTALISSRPETLENQTPVETSSPRPKGISKRRQTACIMGDSNPMSRKVRPKVTFHRENSTKSSIPTVHRSTLVEMLKNIKWANKHKKLMLFQLNSTIASKPKPILKRRHTEWTMIDLNPMSRVDSIPSQVQLTALEPIEPPSPSTKPIGDLPQNSNKESFKHVPQSIITRPTVCTTQNINQDLVKHVPKGILQRRQTDVADNITQPYDRGSVFDNELIEPLLKKTKRVSFEYIPHKTSKHSHKQDSQKSKLQNNYNEPKSSQGSAYANLKTIKHDSVEETTLKKSTVDKVVTTNPLLQSVTQSMQPKVLDNSMDLQLADTSPRSVATFPKRITQRRQMEVVEEKLHPLPSSRQTTAAIMPKLLTQRRQTEIMDEPKEFPLSGTCQKQVVNIPNRITQRRKTEIVEKFKRPSVSDALMTNIYVPSSSTAVGPFSGKERKVFCPKKAATIPRRITHRRQTEVVEDIKRLFVPDQVKIRLTNQKPVINMPKRITERRQTEVFGKLKRPFESVPVSETVTRSPNVDMANLAPSTLLKKKPIQPSSSSISSRSSERVGPDHVCQIISNQNQTEAVDLCKRPNDMLSMLSREPVAITSSSFNQQNDTKYQNSKESTLLNLAWMPELTKVRDESKTTKERQGLTRQDSLVTIKKRITERRQTFFESNSFREALAKPPLIPVPSTFLKNKPSQPPLPDSRISSTVKSSISSENYGLFVPDQVRAKLISQGPVATIPKRITARRQTEVVDKFQRQFEPVPVMQQSPLPNMNATKAATTSNISEQSNPECKRTKDMPQMPDREPAAITSSSSNEKNLTEHQDSKENLFVNPVWMPALPSDIEEPKNAIEPQLLTDESVLLSVLQNQLEAKIQKMIESIPLFAKCTKRAVSKPVKEKNAEFCCPQSGAPIMDATCSSSTTEITDEDPALTLIQPVEEFEYGLNSNNRVLSHRSTITLNSIIADLTRVRDNKDDESKSENDPIHDIITAITSWLPSWLHDKSPMINGNGFIAQPILYNYPSFSSYLE